MKKWINRLALTIVENPVFTVFFGWALVTVFIIFYDKNLMDKNPPIQFYWWFLGSFLLATIFSWFLKNKIIVAPTGEHRRKNEVLIKVNNKTNQVVEISHRTMWRKRNHTIHSVLVTKQTRRWKKEKRIETSVEIQFKKGNIQVLIPATISVIVEGEFDWQEVYEKLVLKGIPSVEEFIQITFSTAIEEKRSQMMPVIKPFVNGEISQSQTINRLIDLLDFPNWALQNLPGFSSIKLGEVKLSGCKGNCEV